MKHKNKFIKHKTMKKLRSILITLYIVLAFIFASCSKEELIAPVVPYTPNDTIIVDFPYDTIIDEPIMPNQDPDWLMKNVDYVYFAVTELNESQLQLLEISPRYNYDESNSIHFILYRYNNDSIVIRLNGKTVDYEQPSKIIDLAYTNFDTLINDFEKIKYVEENYSLQKYTIRLEPKVSLYENTEPCNICWNIIPVYQGISIDFGAYVNHHGNGHLKIRYSDYVSILEWLYEIKNIY